jgi:hypothetical protein
MTVRVEIKIDFVPLYFSTGKSRTVLAYYTCRGGGHINRTIVDLQPVGATFQWGIIVPLCQLAESRQTGRPHPDLELLPCMQVWKLCHAVVTILWKLFHPERWHSYLPRLVLSLAV